MLEKGWSDRWGMLSWVGWVTDDPHSLQAVCPRIIPPQGRAFFKASQ
jgi:hypothetical protein